MRNIVVNLKLIFRRILRKIQLLQLIDAFRVKIRILQNRKANEVFLSQHRDFNVPPYYLADDAYNHVNWQSYYDSGKEHARFIANWINECNSADSDVLRVCEWGCGPGRVIRHLYSYVNHKTVEIYGTDYNEETISWCKKNIHQISFLHNGIEPPLPFGSHFFDCIYAISVLTHLSEEAHYAWIRELFRVLKTNGIVILTTHGNNYLKYLLPGEKRKYDSGELVILGNIKEGKKLFLALHPPTFMKNRLLKDYYIVQHITDEKITGLEQDVWIIKNAEDKDKSFSTKTYVIKSER
jgi:SAM-dependent methyltransferase